MWDDVCGVDSGILGLEHREVVRNTPVHVESVLVLVYNNHWVRLGWRVIHGHKV